MALERRKVVILGGGFGGLWAARALKGADCDVTLVDRRNHHLFQPLLYQVATATLDPSDIAAPIRSILRRQKNMRVELAEVTAIDPKRRAVILADGEVPYDYLIVATGARHSYFGKDQWEKHAPGLKTLEDAIEMRRRVLLAYEAAERETDPTRRKALLTFIIIGAGPTGVELAGALAEISRYTMRHDFRRIDPREAQILLLEGVDRVLPTYPVKQSGRAQKQLERLGVKVRTGARVTDIDADGVSLGDERIAARTVLWAAGVAASPIARSLGVPLDKAGRVLVDATLQVPGHDEIYVVGDLASLQQDGKPVPGVSPAAMQGGRYAARAIRARLRDKPVKPFRYLDKGTFATIGRGRAVGDLFGRLQLSGLPAWLAWLGIHIFFLVGFRARLFVFFSWAYSYLSHRRGARLITGATVPILLVPPAAAEAPATAEPAATQQSR